jgi:putative ABC transport system permease protein
LFRVERGYRDSYGIGLLALLVASTVVTLGAAGVATGLAQADARADLATLAAVGAPPRVRRILTAFHAAVVAGLGALLGTASGLVPMLGFLYADPEMQFVAPWRNLLVIALVVPAAAAVSAGLLTRSRLPLVRRVA